MHCAQKVRTTIAWLILIECWKIAGFPVVSQENNKTDTALASSDQIWLSSSVLAVNRFLKQYKWHTTILSAECFWGFHLAQTLLEIEYMYPPLHIWIMGCIDFIPEKKNVYQLPQISQSSFDARWAKTGLVPLLLWNSDRQTKCVQKRCRKICLNKISYSLNDVISSVHWKPA